MEKHRPLKTFVYGVLIRRLALAAVLVATVLSAVTYNHSRDMVINTVVEISGMKIAMARAHFRDLMKRGDLNPREALIQAINYPPGARVRIKEGHYVYAMVYDGKGRHVEVYEDADYPAINAVKRYVSGVPAKYPDTDELENSVVDIADRPFIYTNIRLIADPELSPTYLHGVFALSDQTIGMVERQVAKAILNVFVIVFSTTLLLYPVITRLTGKLADFSANLLAANLEMLEVLGATIAKRDSDTDAHNYRVTIYALRLAETVGLDTKEIQSLIKGSFLHDVGKIGIRDDILLKPGKLDDSEFEVMKSHVNHGLDIIRKSDWLKDAAGVVGGHHEKYDGQGYPANMVADAIPVAARIFAIADVFDALASRRPYKEPFSFEKIMEILKQGKGSHFDPDLLEKFSGIARELYDEFSGRDDERLKEQLRVIITRYFRGGLDTLNY